MKLMRYYNQNRKKIWGIIIIIASFLALLQLFNFFSKMDNEEKLSSGLNNKNEKKIDTEQSTVTANQSVVTGDNISSNKLKSDVEVIDNFILYCNNKELEKAYNLITDECKEQMYNTIQIFEEAYYNNVFNGKYKNCTIENWINDTYKVSIIEDSLSTGKSNNGYSKQDYITIKNINGESKININNYIGYAKIEKTTEKNNIVMKIIEKNTFMDYEEYKIKVSNNTENLIILDSKADVKSLYLEDEKGVKYSSYSHEITDPMLTIQSGQTRELNIKFYTSYVSSKKIKSMVFSDLIKYTGQSGEKEIFKIEL